MEKTRRLIDYAATAVFAAVAFVALLTFRDYGLGWDDYTHSQYGQLLLEYYRSGLSDKRALSFVNLYMYGGGFDMAAALLDRFTPFDLFETRRLFGAVVGIIGLAVTWRLARRLGGAKLGSWAGLAAVLLLASCPQYYGHMFINPKDGPFAVAMMVLLLGLARALEEYPKPSLPTVLIFGAGLGLAIGSRILAGMAALYMLVPLAMIIGSELRATNARDAARNFGRFVLILLPALVLAYAIMAAVWPWSVQDPLNPLRAVSYFSEFFEKPWKEMFEGVPISVPDMPRNYIPVLFALKIPEIFIALALCGIVGSVAAAFRSTIPIRRRAAFILVVFAALLPVTIAIVTRPAMYNGIRHFLFVIPPLAVLGGLAAGFIIEAIRKKSQQVAIAFALIMFAGVIVPVTDMVRIHPYQYANFNRIAGGIYEADDNYMLDYWGLAFKQAAQGLRDKLTEQLETPTKGRRWRVAVCGPHAAAEVELGPEFVTTWEPKGADFAMMLGTYYCAEYDAPVLVEIEREDVVFARVYDIRGKNYTSVFNNPTNTPQTGPQQQ
ncbi:MAG TPA: glycosyltransferase family 39 protein [Pseudorhodoplanes sp.]|nr:glycosyltransferase family 39 protein [Pseudorhodoplanes sp.]